LKPEGKSPAETELAAARFRMAKRVRHLHVSTKNGQIVENERPALGER